MHIEKRISKINWVIVGTIPLFFFSIAAPICGWFGVFKLEESPFVWFQRSGSIMVLFAVWIEFNLFKVSDLSIPRKNGGSVWQDFEDEDILREKYGLAFSLLKYLAAILAVIGTVIWGYGDILMSSIKQS